MQGKKVWMNGKIVEWDQATIHVGTHALHYGSGVFEGIRAYQTTKGTGIFRLNDHVERLIKSAAYYQMELPYSNQELTNAIWDLISANQLKSCYVRPIAYRGLKELGVYPLNCPVDVAILTWQWGAYLGEEGLKHGIRATISKVKRFSDDMMPTAAKATGQYLNSILAKLDAHQRGFEEAIMLNENKTVAEGSGENLFIVREGRVITPRLEDSILPGLTRKTVIDICRHLKIACSEEPIRLVDLYFADEVFATGTAAEITPIRSIDDHVIGEPGPITKQIQDIFFATIAGEDTAFKHLMEYQN